MGPMKELTLSGVKAVYREAIDPAAPNAEWASWWAAVATEAHTVVSAPTEKAAGEIIAWWHREWSVVEAPPPSACALRPENSRPNLRT